ncbi:ParA family protein [Methylophaga sp. OBS3]|uniref:ParA family protein n=1 Tax=Methylophaga sp. OBS3 TaxID=2991934 RepID=UPI002253A758|nr:ParA family protein [Methylophaga sp. OBS3]MCX4188681.1 ParA family protein [Methylophaga sp. OBS3]
MIVWAVANQKGGVGKTTSVISLASILAQKGHSTLVLDMDPHGSLTTYLGYDPDQLESSIYTLFQQLDSNPNSAILQALKKTRVPNLFLLPAATAMATLDRQLGVQSGKGLVIKQTLQHLQDRFEYVLIDCPPMLGVLMINALAACDKLLIPVQTEFLAIKGLEKMLHTMAMINHSRRQKIPYVIVPTMYDKRTRAANQSLLQLQMQYPDAIWPQNIPEDTRFRDASKAGIPLPIIAPESRGSEAYSSLLKYLQKTTEQTVAQAYV